MAVDIYPDLSTEFATLAPSVALYGDGNPFERLLQL
jgi:hypothetical protein